MDEEQIEQIARLQRLVAVTEANRRSQEEQQKLESIRNEMAGLRQAATEDEHRQKSLPQCPACGGRLDGEFRKCKHCASDLVWIDGHVCEPGQEEPLRQRLAAVQEAADAIKRRQDAAADAIKRRQDAAMHELFSTKGQPFINLVGMRFVAIPPGEFLMGSPAGEKDRQDTESQVSVTLTKPFGLGKYEVTQGQWKTVMSTEPWWKKMMGTEPWKGKDFVQADKDCPATYVSWDDATEFCKKLTDLERKSGTLKAGEEYRLPTEAEWEYACRAGTETAFLFGDDEKQLSEYAWFNGNASHAGEPYAHIVCLKKPNPWGLHDMHGNVFEWCSDWYAGKLSGGTDPVGPDWGAGRVVRGGCWGNDPGDCRSAFRDYLVPSVRGYGLGFRVARSQSVQ